MSDERLPSVLLIKRTGDEVMVVGAWQDGAAHSIVKIPDGGSFVISGGHVLGLDIADIEAELLIAADFIDERGYFPRVTEFLRELCHERRKAWVSPFGETR